MSLRRAPEGKGATRRHHQPAANALQCAHHHQLGDGLGQPAKEGREGKHCHGADKQAPKPESIPEPRRQRQHGRAREEVGRDSRAERQRLYVQSVGHARQRGIQNGAIEQQHEEARRNYEGYSIAVMSRLGGSRSARSRTRGRQGLEARGVGAGRV